jgi:cytochrome bd-type quinol oxidase subunit 2
MTTQQLAERPARQRQGARSGWRLGIALVVLSAIPLSAGILRLVQLAGGPSLMPTDPRFDGFPIALVTHIVGSAVFALFGALQLVPAVRRRHRAWHRRAGRTLIVAGLLVVASALWLTLFYDAQPGTGTVLFVVRLVVAPAMAACLVLGFAAIRRRDLEGHRAWMVRAYALGLGAGTQVFTQSFADAIFGDGVVAGDLAKTAGWAINLAVAEWAIRRPAVRRRRRAAARAVA